jgi:hypothetical protein
MMIKVASAGANEGTGMKNTPPCLLLLLFSLALPSNADAEPRVSVVELLHITPCAFLERLTTVKTSPPCYVEPNGTEVIYLQKKWITMKDVRDTTSGGTS